MIACMNTPNTRSPGGQQHAESEQAVLGGLLHDNAATAQAELAGADFYSANHRGAPGLPGESCEGDVVSHNCVSLIDLHANLMQKAFAAGRMDDARAYCKIFTKLLRERAKPFLSDSTCCAAPPADSCPAGRPSPHHDRNARGDARQEK